MSIEYQDVVDGHDNVVQSLPVDEIWAKGLQSHTRVINVFIVNQDGLFLLPVRSLSKGRWPGLYDFACGENLISGETYDQALARGMQEEIGISDFTSEFLCKLTPSDEEVCFMQVYLVKVDSHTVEFKCNPDEIDHLEWKTQAEITDLIAQHPEQFKPGYPQLFTRCFITDK